jgi:predicted RNase H-like HicB family nuclease
MNEMKYTIEIFYSEEDEGYIAVVPELPGCSAFGETPEEALKEVKIAIELWIETAKNEGREIPKPMCKELLKDVLSKLKIRVID